jgi:hypothetical protein
MTDIATTYVRVRPNTAGFQKEAEAQLKGAVAGISKGLAFAIGGLGVAEGVKTLAEEAAQHESAVDQTRAAVKAAGAQWVVYGKNVEQALDEQARATGFSFEDLYQGFIRLETQIKNTPQALKVLGEAEDVARARHLGLAQAATALARASAGNVQSLSRLGIIIPKSTQAQDALKGKLLEVTHALDAQREARAKNYVGTIHLTDAELALTKLTPIQLKSLAEHIKLQQAQAKASDLQGSAAAALAEVQRRYGTQAETYAKTAAGEYARFRVEVAESAAELGKVLLPYLSDAASKAGEWAREVGESKGAANGLKVAAGDVAKGVHSIGNAIDSVKPELKLLGDLVQAVGPGPILAGVAAYKGISIAIGLATRAQEKFDAAVALGAKGMQAEAEAQAAVTAESEAGAAGSAGRLGLAGRGLAAGLFGPTGAIIGVGLLAGGLYYLSTIQDETQKKTEDLQHAYESLAKATSGVKAAQDQVASARSAVGDASAARAAAADALKQAKARLDAAVDASKSATAEARAADAVAAAEARWRDANRTLIGSEHAKVTAINSSKKATDAQTKSYIALIAKQIDLLHWDATTRVAARQSQIIGGGSVGAATAAAQLLNLANKTKGLTEAQKFGLRQTADYIKALDKVPDDKTLYLLLDDEQFYNKLHKAVGAFQDADRSFYDWLTQKSTSGGSRGGPSLKVAQKSGGELGKASATAYTTAFVQTIDASSIAQALSDSIGQARSQIESSGNALASAVGDALDKRLADREKVLNATQKAIQDDIAKRNAAASARGAQQTNLDAATKLKELQDELGGGALTADQQVQLQAAKNAVLDAQDAIANASDQAKSDSIDKQKTALEAQNDAAKTAASRRIADLDAEFNRGLISQAKYIAGVRGLLGREQVNYKTTGRLLGGAFADGFRDSLGEILAQSKALGATGQAKLRGAPTGAKAVSPLGDEAKAIQAFIDQVAQSGGRFNVANADKLPKGVKLGDLISAAASQKADAAYRQKTGKQGDATVEFTGQTADHTRDILRELQKPKPPVVVVVPDAKTAKRKIAQATRK